MAGKVRATDMAAFGVPRWSPDLPPSMMSVTPPAEHPTYTPDTQRPWVYRHGGDVTEVKRSTLLDAALKKMSPKELRELMKRLLMQGQGR